VVIEVQPSEAERRLAGEWADSELEVWVVVCQWAAASAVAVCHWEADLVVAASAAAAVSVAAVTEEAEEATGNQPDPHSRGRPKQTNGFTWVAVSLTDNPVGEAVSGLAPVTELEPSTRRPSGRWMRTIRLHAFTCPTWPVVFAATAR
jgi:hypothetical protein